MKVGVLARYHKNNRLVNATLCFDSKIPKLCSALIDSGSEQNLIPPEMIKKY